MNIKHKRIYLTALLFLALLTFGATRLSLALTQPVTATAVSDLNPSNLLVAVNMERSKAAMTDLTLDAKLNASASDKCTDMATYNYWSHDNPNGTKWQSFVNKQTTYLSAGENLAHGFTTTPQVIDGWMNSPTHKANIMNSQYTNVGYAICSDEKLGNIVVQHFIDSL